MLFRFLNRVLNDYKIMDKELWLKRQSEKIKLSPITEDNKEALLKFIETRYLDIESNELSFIIKVISSLNFDINLKTMETEDMIKTFDVLNSLRWQYSATSFQTMKFYWKTFLKVMNSIYNLNLDVKAEFNKFNRAQRKKFILIQKPIEVKT